MIPLNISRRLLSFALVSLCFLRVVAAQENNAWTKGNEEYAAGHFREAADLYETLVRDGQTSAAVFYNLGNARFRAGEFGQAILNYERALALAPQHPETMANLRHARDKARALELKRSRLDDWSAHASGLQYSIAVAVAFWVAVFAIAVLCFSRRRAGLAAFVLMVALLALAAAACGLYSRESGANGAALAIVTAKGTDARLAPADSAGTVLILPPGSEIQIVSTRGEWIYATLPNDLRGWIPAANAERVRL